MVVRKWRARHVKSDRDAGGTLDPLPSTFSAVSSQTTEYCAAHRPFNGGDDELGRRPSRLQQHLRSSIVLKHNIRMSLIQPAHAVLEPQRNRSNEGSLIGRIYG